MARVGQEAMAMGVPVIATPESGLGMWLEKGGGLVLPHENWSSSLDSLITNMRDSWLDFSTRAFETAKAWTWRDHAKLLLTQIGFS